MNFKRVLSVVDCHAEGEIGKVIVGGVGQVPGETMFDKRVYLETHRDDIRKMVLFEPRGAVWHNANIVLPSNNPKADMGYIIMESTEYPVMSGSNTICVATVLLETGILPMQEPVTNLTLESPAGLITLRCTCANGKVTSVRFVNQPAFCYYTDTKIDVPGLGKLRVDVAYGGMTYVWVDAQELGFGILPNEARQLCELGQKIKMAAVEQLPVSHPVNPAIPGITILGFGGPLRREADQLVSRNCVVVSPGRCDRSPCGTGTSARLAILHAKGLIGPGETFIHESITSSRFTCAIDGLTKVGAYDAVIPAIAGQAWITGLNQMVMDRTDPYPDGYTLSDTWMSSPDPVGGH
jgi:proline racemase